MPTEETTPDQLMDAFRGRSVKSIIVFTVVIHLIVLIGSSAPFLYRSVMGQDSSGLSEEKKLENAVREARLSLQKIAEEHGLKPQDLSSQFAGGRPGAPKAPAAEGGAPAVGGQPAESGEPKSALEQEIEKVEVGPTVPGTADEEEDLFK